MKKFYEQRKMFERQHQLDPSSWLQDGSPENSHKKQATFSNRKSSGDADDIQPAKINIKEQGKEVGTILAPESYEEQDKKAKEKSQSREEKKEPVPAESKAEYSYYDEEDEAQEERKSGDE